MITGQKLLYHIGITLFETLSSFFLCYYFNITDCCNPLVFQNLIRNLRALSCGFKFLPKSALAPLLIVWLGGNYKTIIITGMSVAIFGSILSLYTAFCDMDKEKILLIKTLGGTRNDVMFKIMLPGCIPTLLSIMKVNIGLCLVGVIIGEFIAAKKA